MSSGHCNADQQSSGCSRLLKDLEDHNAGIEYPAETTNLRDSNSNRESDTEPIGAPLHVQARDGVIVASNKQGDDFVTRYATSIETQRPFDACGPSPAQYDATPGSGGQRGSNSHEPDSYFKMPPTQSDKPVSALQSGQPSLCAKLEANLATLDAIYDKSSESSQLAPRKRSHQRQPNSALSQACPISGVNVSARIDSASSSCSINSNICDNDHSGDIDSNQDDDESDGHHDIHNKDDSSECDTESSRGNKSYKFNDNRRQQAVIDQGLNGWRQGENSVLRSRIKGASIQSKMTKLNLSDSKTSVSADKSEQATATKRQQQPRHQQLDLRQQINESGNNDDQPQGGLRFLEKSANLLRESFNSICPSRASSTLYFNRANNNFDKPTSKPPQVDEPQQEEPPNSEKHHQELQHRRQSQIGEMSGSNVNRYQSFDYYLEPRSNRKLSIPKTISRDFQRLYSYSNGSLKGNYQRYDAAPKQTLLQSIKRILILLLMILICCAVLWRIYQALTADINYLGVVETKSVLGHFSKYAVSTDASPCAAVGKNLLAKGGSAVDAAIGTVICMGIVLPNSLGLGGGCLMTIYDSKQKNATIIDGREEAPDYATENMFVGNPLLASRGPLSVGVPGEIAAYWRAHQMFGKLKWSELFDESILLAENGVSTVEHLAFALEDRSHSKYLSEELAQFFTNPETGEFLKEGELLVQKSLANTLRRLQKNGASEFYGGLTGKLFIEDLKKQGGKMTLENLVRYQPIVRKPLKFELAEDLHLYTPPPPGSGVILSIIMRIMKELGYYKHLRPQDSFEGSSLYYHHLSEAFKFAYAQRAGLEDQPDDPIRMEKLMNKIMSEDFIKASASMINSQAHHDNRYGGNEFFSEDHGTAHVSVLNDDGMAVAITSSVNLYFGSGLVSGSTGIIYNDLMDDFVSPNITNKFGLMPSKYNHIKPGRRPISSMAPSIFTDARGDIRLVIGSSGGAKITSSIALVSLRNLFLGDDLKTSIDGPRLHHQYLPDQIFFESNFPKPLLMSLYDRGHKLAQITGRSSVVMSIAVDYDDDEVHYPGAGTPARPSNRTKHITANSDYRKGGRVDGF